MNRPGGSIQGIMTDQENILKLSFIEFVLLTDYKLFTQPAHYHIYSHKYVINKQVIFPLPKFKKYIAISKLRERLSRSVRPRSVRPLISSNPPAYSSSGVDQIWKVQAVYHRFDGQFAWK